MTADRAPGITRFPVGISACLLGQAVRYDGGHRKAVLLEECLGRHFDWIPVCPEVEIGLGVPREPIRLEGDAAAPRLVSVATRLDLTGTMSAYAARRSGELAAAALCGYVFKKDSPSCGVAGVPVHGGGKTSAGLFAGVIQATFPGLPVAEEDELRDEAACLAFVEKVRAYGFERARDLKRGS